MCLKTYGKILPKGSERYSRPPTPAHTRLRTGSQARERVSRLSAGAAVSCPPSLVPAASPCSSGLRLVLPQCSAPVPHLCPRVSRHRWFSARRRFLPISPRSVGPTMLEAALLHSSGSEQGAGCPECTGEGPGCPSVNHESFLQIHSITVWGFFKQALTPSTANTAFALTHPLQKQLGGLYTARGTEVMGTAQRGKKITQKAASCQPK